MAQKYSKYKFSVRMIIWGLVTMFASLILCIFHVYDIENTYLEQHKQAYTMQITVAMTSLENQMNQMNVNLDKLCKEIENIYPEENKGTVANLINTSAEISGYTKTLFKDNDGKVFASSGTPLQIIEAYELMNIKNEQQVQGLLVENDEGLLENYFSIEKEVYSRGEKIGIVSIFFDTTNIFENSTFDYLTNEGFCYLTNLKDTTLAMSIRSEKLLEKKVSFSTILGKTFGVSNDSRVYYMTLFGDIENEKNGAKYITAENGERYLVAYQSIVKTDDMYFLSYYNIERVWESINHVVFRTALYCIFIIVLMILLLMFVWLSSMKTTSIIEKMAYEDEVTKGKNLNYFKVKAYEILKANKQGSYLVERFDIANFRYINEAYGHERADELLRACLQLAEQIFLENELCARMHSDQFVLLIINDSLNKVRWAEYRQAVNEYARTLGIKYPIRFKVGIYQVREYDQEINMMIDRANAARKLVSSNSKTMVRVYSDSIVEEMRRIDRIESDMNRALQDGEFQVYFQQKWNIETDKIHGAEALIRWVKPEGTVILPGEFIPLFEKNGFIEKLDYYVLETVCAKQKELFDAGNKCVPISVNQSKVLLNNSDYVRNVERIINRYNIPREIIVLEVTETVFLNDEKAIEKIVKELKNIGVLVSMDDFGSGYSSLTLLKDIPFDVIKIDKGFVSDSLTSEKSRWILRKIIEMADGLGMSVICEGIETQEQLDNVRKLGCVIIQGFFHGKPIPMDEFCENFLEKITC